MICDKPMNDYFQHTDARLAGSPLQLKPKGGTDEGKEEEEEERTMKETTRPRWQNQEPPLGGAVGGVVR